MRETTATVQYTLLIYSASIGKFEGHLVYLGEISERRSLIRETNHHDEYNYVSIHNSKGGVHVGSKCQLINSSRCFNIQCTHINFQLIQFTVICSFPSNQSYLSFFQA